MSTPQFRSSIALTVVGLAVLACRPIQAQVPGNPPATPEPGNLVNRLVTGVEYDIKNQELAEHRLQSVQAKLRRDAEQGNHQAVSRDTRRIANLKFRIVVDEWLIRQNSLLEPGCYPYPVQLDAMTCAVIADATRPAPFYYPLSLAPPVSPLPGSVLTPMYGSPTISLTIINADSTKTVTFAINGTSYDSAGGSTQTLNVPPDASLTFDAGGTIGQRKYLVAPGRYEFRSTAEGWALYKLPDMP